MRRDSTPLSVEGLFEIAIEFVTLARDFYESMARAFAYVPRVADFWFSLLTDQRRHLQSLCEVREDLTRSVLAAPADPHVLRFARQARAIFDSAMIRSIRTLGEACEAALEIETSEADRVLLYLLSAYGGWSVPLGDLAARIEIHRTRLLEFRSQVMGSPSDAALPAVIRKLEER